MLKSVEEIVDGVGGTAAAASLARVGMSAISNWKTRGKIPADQFLVFSEALKGSGLEPDPTLFTFVPVEGVAE